MVLPAGTRVGSYEIVGAVGFGGMGEVYRAHDTKLHRDVAIKVLPKLFLHDPERLARFEREAQALAALNHPNIAQIYGLQEYPSPQPDESAIPALVMELVDGPTLDELIDARRARGGIGVDDALDLGRQIAEALEAAHERGIVHRDLKPANIKVRDDGAVKVLDFGLAKAFDGAPDADAASDATYLTPADMTRAGVILGTAGYMAPEQARGLIVDKRADIWAFGCILFEVLTGTKAFGGQSIADALSAVTRDEPDWSLIPNAVGPSMRTLLRHCLRKDLRQRLRDIGDARITIDDARRGDPHLPANPASSAGPTLSFAVPLAANEWLPLDESLVLALSRDGRTLVYVAASRNGRQLYRRDLARLEPVPIPGTAGAQHPFLSPDGHWVGFIADGWLKKIPIEGGVATVLCEVTALHRGATWAPDGRIVFSPAMDRPLMQIEDTGGEVKPLTTIDAAQGERSHRWPDMAADNRSIVFTIGSSATRQDYDGGHIGIASLNTGHHRVLATGGRMARSAPGERLFVQRRATLLQAPFDPNAQAPSKPSTTLLEGIGGDASSGSGYFAVGGNVLAYAPAAAVAERLGVFVVDRTGTGSRLPLPPKGYWYPRVSPDGTRIAFHIADERDLDARGTRGDIWVYELESNRMWRVTQGNRNTYPCWSPDGQRVAYEKVGTPSGVYVRSVDGSGGEESLWTIQRDTVRLPESWHRDGTLVAVTGVDNSIDAWLVSTAGESRLIATGGRNTWGAVFSPAGRHVAYTSVEDGTPYVFVESVAGGGGRWHASPDGGVCPVWSRDGRELFFLKGETVMVADVSEAADLRIGTPRPLFRSTFDLRLPPPRNYDVLRDGRFVMVGHVDDIPAVSAIHVMVNPFDDLKPVRRR